MAEKTLSARSQRRLRLEIARSLVAENQSQSRAKRICINAKPSATCPTDSSPLRIGEECSIEVEGYLRPASDEDVPDEIVSDEECSGTDVGGSTRSSDSEINSSLDSDSPSDEEAFSLDSLSLSSGSGTLSSSVSECDEHSCSTLDSTRLFTGSEISKDFVTAFMSVVQRHLTYACQTDMLKLLKIVLPPPSEVPISSRTLVKHFVNYEKEVEVTHFCGHCCVAIDRASGCLNPGCSRQKCPHSVFVRIPLSSQIKDRFTGMLYMHVVI